MRRQAGKGPMLCGGTLAFPYQTSFPAIKEKGTRQVPRCLTNGAASVIAK